MKDQLPIILVVSMFVFSCNNERNQTERKAIEAPIEVNHKERELNTTDTTSKPPIQPTKSIEPVKAKTIKTAVKKEVPQKKPGSLSFAQKTYNYGTISSGDKIDYVFKYKNTGDLPIEINDAQASCGCTQPAFSFMPVSPGEEGELSVVFNSKGKKGFQKSVITITTTGNPKIYKLFLEGTVEIKPEIKQDSSKKTPNNTSLRN